MILSVPDMSCAHCKAAIEAALGRAGGRAEVDLAARTVSVTGLDRPAAEAAIRAAGYAPGPA
ncbi:heavy-metal-associated domain-containing protein [Paracoccus spongiarum]|uniref:Cation transporter n=1 Tax=Paracoccus spongiarum TaxID=3064387 RepID=A0ABT9JDX3_9RHOB|nr:cation transporter [Paracoccus sp. 2205BS29-5]MDP5308013.1 cation transporter [Paracoccus sp. 2205BS29-5]